MNRNDTTNTACLDAAQAYISKQREAILERLRQGPATVAELMHDCRASDPRKRISELRRDGHEIDSHEIKCPSGDGTVNHLRLYALRSCAHPTRYAPAILERIGRFVGGVCDLAYACCSYVTGEGNSGRRKPSMSHANTQPPARNTTERQRDAVLARLAQGPATAAELMHDCRASDPRKRISELRRDGHEIDFHEIERPNGDGTVNCVRVYVLRVKDTRKQGGKHD